jgi:pyrophosphatase PpaX
LAVRNERCEAVLFDGDGTLFDTVDLTRACFRHALRKGEVEVEDVEVVATIKLGRSLEESYQMLAGVEDVTGLCEAHEDFQREHLNLVSLFPGVKEALDRLRLGEVKMAVVTNRAGNAVQLLEITGIDEFFGVVVTGNDVESYKPDPEGINKALKKLGVSAERAVMVGDTDVDVLAGRDAGVRTARVLYGPQEEGGSEVEADYEVGGLLEMVLLLGESG